MSIRRRKRTTTEDDLIEQMLTGRRQRGTYGDHKNNPQEIEALNKGESMWERGELYVTEKPDMSWAGKGYDLQTREGQLHHRVHQNLAFGEVHPHIGPTVHWHKPGICDQSRKAKGSPHSHVDGLEAPADYWWLGPNGYWQSLCARCVLVDMAVAVENPDLGPVVILPVVHREH